MPSQPHPSSNPAHQLLRQAGLRCTSTRVRVLALLLDNARPSSHAQLSDQLAAVHVDRVTLYRTLTCLEQNGLVHRVRGTDGVWRYCVQVLEDRTCPGNHAHFLCLVCGAMQCLLDQAMPRLCSPPGARIIAKQLVAHGVCQRCVEDEAFAEKGVIDDHGLAQYARLTRTAETP